MKRVVWIIFVASFASVLIERGLYFIVREALHFSDTLNLWLALLYGVVYVVGAVISHAVSQRVGERRALAAAFVGQVVMLVVLTMRCTTVVAFVGTFVLATLNGFKWPIFESYVNAGLTPTESFRTIGRFNLAWASAVPLALGVEGRMIVWWDTSPFAFAALINFVVLLLILRFPARPTHLADDHPERPDGETLRRETGLLHFSRWTMLLSYICLWVITPLAPGIFARLGVETANATVFASTADWARLAAFVALMLSAWWRGSVATIAVAFLFIPAGFFLTVLAPTVPLAVAGLVAVGFGAGLSYYASLSYAMTVKNASVEAGGGHEGFIGAGFFFGPLAGLAGTAATGAFASAALGMVVGVGPFVVVCGGVGVALMVRKLRRRS